jgi:hypothetical protein
VYEIHRPGVIYRPRPFAHRPQMTKSLAAATAPQRKSFLPVEPFDAFVIYRESRAPEHLIEHRATPAAARFSQRSQPLPRLVVAIRAGLPIKRASGNSDQPAGATLRQMMVRCHFRYHLSLHRGP